ncbi:uncharacterized protein TM35_000311400 [Trypanosoma theileri]|uniref:Uncharacterized protein n=1 Tax=Trypanosoma theileri TaxID=67003 RepID=A0A1X0NMJ0_9TRYP|nr:uncharacterized protein TM35_000311400 [Trypanosoma theileri]ORC85954.1 hypothetical protein TM35_000311400 [Trypanosoma theileri]
MKRSSFQDVERKSGELDPSIRQTQEFEDIRFSISRIEELLEHGQSLLYDQHTEKGAVVSPTVSDGEPTLKRGTSFPSTTSPQDDPHAKKKERKGSKMTERPEKVRLRTVGMAGRSRGGTPASFSLGLRRPVARRRGTEGEMTAPSEDSVMEEVSVEELRRRIHAELEEYRRHGPLTQWKPQPVGGEPRQRVERVNPRRRGQRLYTPSVRKEMKPVTPQTKEIATRAPRGVNSFGVAKGSNNHINNTNNHNKKNTVGLPNRSPNTLRDVHQQQRQQQNRSPAWERLYDDAARIREKKRQKEIERQKEESNYKLKKNPYDPHSLRKRFSLKVASMSTASHSVPHKESHPSVPVVTEKGRRGFDIKTPYHNTPQQTHKLDAPGRIFARRHVKPQEPPLQKPEDNEKEYVNSVNEPLHSGSPLHTEADDSCVEENVVINKNEVQKSVETPDVEPDTKAITNNLVKSPMHSVTSEEDILNQSGASKTSSERLGAASLLASSDEVWELPLRNPREATSTPIPVIVRPLDLRALRK